MGVCLISRLGARVSGQGGEATTTEAVLHVHANRVGLAVRTGQETVAKLYTVALSAGASSELTRICRNPKRHYFVVRDLNSIR